MAVHFGLGWCVGGFGGEGGVGVGQGVGCRGEGLGVLQISEAKSVQKGVGSFGVEEEDFGKMVPQPQPDPFLAARPLGVGQAEVVEVGIGVGVETVASGEEILTDLNFLLSRAAVLGVHGEALLVENVSLERVVPVCVLLASLRQTHLTLEKDLLTGLIFATLSEGGHCPHPHRLAYLTISEGWVGRAGCWLHKHHKIKIIQIVCEATPLSAANRNNMQLEGSALEWDSGVSAAAVVI